jgi:hypothetical protein
MIIFTASNPLFKKIIKNHMKRIMQLPVVLSLFIATGLLSCSDNGKRVKVEGTKGEVFYKEGVTEEEAKQVGNVLKDGFLGNDKAASIQVVKDSGAYTVRFVYDQEYYEKNPGFDKDFRAYAARISKEVFDGRKVNVALADNRFRDFKKIPFEEPEEAVESGLAPAAPPAGPIENETYSHETRGDVNFYWKGITDSESKTIIDYIVQNGAFAGGTAHLYLTKEGDRYLLQFPVKEEYRNDEGIIAAVEKVSKEIKDNVFATFPFTFQMTDEKLNKLRSFDY